MDQGPKGAHNDDIEVLVATVIDLDPRRKTNTASTDAELERALEAANAAADWSETEGLVRPRQMMSGNGAQLWFALPPTVLLATERERYEFGLETFQRAVRERFENDAVKIDSIHDFARVIKVMGTVSRKGDGLDDRPHRVSVALSDFGRIEDPSLLARLQEPPAPTRGKRNSSAMQAGLPLVTNTLPTGTAKAARTPDGTYDWEHPVEMCGPIQRLWSEGAEDRSLAIFDMIRFFMHKGLGLEEITELIVEYDRRGLGKLDGRDGPTYVRKAYEKIQASRSADGKIAPPCHSLQSFGYCSVNHPGVHCELHSVVFDIEKAIADVPVNVPASALEYRLHQIFDAISRSDPSRRDACFALIEQRFGAETVALYKNKPLPAGARDEPHEGKPRADLPEDCFDGEIQEGQNCYYCTSARGAVRVISSFAIAPTMRVTTEEGELIFGDAHTDNGATVKGLRFPVSAFQSRRDLMKCLPSADLQWTGNDNNAQGLLRLLSRRQVPQLSGSLLLGDYRREEHHLWLGPGCVISQEGFLEPAPVIYVPNGGSLDKRVKYRATDDQTFETVARVVFENVLRLNQPKVLLPILGWFFATPMKPWLMERVGAFPLLFVWGTQGSGKSTMILDVFWPLFGISGGESFSATETEFAMLKAFTATSSIPIFMDEYKPYDMPKPRLATLHRYMRRLYRAESEERGRPDLRVTTFHLQAPLCLAGETRPTEAALLERVVTSNPDKLTIDASNDCRLAYEALRAAELDLFAPRYIQFCLSRDFDTDYTIAQEVTATLIKARKVPGRIVQNLTAMVLGVHLFEEFAAACGAQLPDQLGVDEAVTAVLDDVLETDHGVKNALDHFMEALAVMAVQGILRHRVHYVITLEGRLAIHLESAYDAFRAHCKRVDYEGEVVDLKALRRLITENRLQKGYVLDQGQKVCFDGRIGRRRAVIVDFDKISEISADDFPTGGGDSSYVDTFRSHYDWHDPS